MNDRTETLRFDDVRRRLQPGDVFRRADHDWKTQSERRWKGGCPWHESSSGACFSVNPETLEWHCFHCERGGGPLEYVAELERIGGGARGSLKGQDFFRAWEALSRHAGCEGPPERKNSGGRSKESDRRPLRKRNSSAKPRKKTRAPQKVESASTKPAGNGAMSRDIPPPRGASGKPAKPDLDTPERELREALVRYREALKESDKARAYVEGRGLSVETLLAYGCGFAPAGEWIGSDNAPRLVTPHTTVPTGGGRPRLVNLDGRYVGSGNVRRHDRIGGNDTELFNASAIAEGSGPLVICEGPMDALSFIEMGHERAIATHGKKGPPWKALSGNVSTVAFAFDRDDEDAKEKAVEYALDAKRLNYEAHVLHDEPTYAGHGDPNEALQHGALNLSYLSDLAPAEPGKPMTDGNPAEAYDGPDSAGSKNNPCSPVAEGPEKPPDGRDPEAGQSLTVQPTDGEGAGEGHTAADLVPYWNGGDIGHLGRWLWERGGVLDGDVGAGLYADRALHKWIAEKLQAGPGGTNEQDRIRLRWVLWRFYAAHGPEDVPARQIPIPPMRRE